MGPGNRMKKQGMPPTVKDLGLDKKRKAVENGAVPTKKRRVSNEELEEPKSPKKLVKLDRRIRQEREEKAAQKEKKQKPKLLNKDAQISVPPPMVVDDEDEGEEVEAEEVLLEDAGLDEEDELEIDDVDLPSGEEEMALADLNAAVLQDDSVFDSDEQPEVKRMFSEDEDDSEGLEKLTAANIEGLSRKLDQQQAEETADAQAELEDAAMQTNLAEDEGVLDSAAASGITPDLQVIRSRMTETIRILGNFSQLSKPEKSRTDYTTQLLSDICTYYGYTPYLAEKLFSLFTPSEAFAFFEANESPRPVVIRTNTLRTNRRSLAQSLINRGVVLEPVGKWSKVGLQIFEAPVPLGATPEYLAGHYLLQAASSFLPVMALAPQPSERILDMAAAPGGKTTYISALMRNTGAVFANDANRQRSKGLIGNIHRLGCKNVVVCNYDAEKAFPKILGGFDRVLLDAPCSGTGVIGKDPSVKTSKDEKDFLRLPHMQKNLLLAAIDSVDHNSKTGGYVVYSTCSVTVEENEGVVQYVLRKRPNVRIVDTGLGTFGSEGYTSFQGKKFDQSMKLARRYFPHRENVDGFFVCKLRKIGPTVSGAGQVNGSAAISEELVEKTSVGNAAKKVNGIVDGEDTIQNDEFGGWDEDADKEIIERAQKKWARAKGLDPKEVARGKEEKEKPKVSGVTTAEKANLKSKSNGGEADKAKAKVNGDTAAKKAEPKVNGPTDKKGDKVRRKSKKAD